MPNRHLFESLPILSLSNWDRVPDVDGALDALDLGQFRQAALLVDAMNRDDRIAGVDATRTGALRAAPITCKATSSKRLAMKIAEELGGSDEEPGKLLKMIPGPVLGELSRWGRHLGIAVAQKVWDTSAKSWTPRLVPFHPQFLRFDWTTKTYRLLVFGESEIVLPRTDLSPRGDQDWFVWTPYGYYYGWLQAMVRYLARIYVMRGWNRRDWARYGEVHGSPITAAKAPANAPKEEKDYFFRAVANRGSEATVMLPQAEGGDQAAQWGIELIEATARTFETFQQFGEKLDIDIAIAILGQNLTTQVNGGSLAATKEHSLVRIDKAKEDAAIGDAIRDQVLTWWAEYNYGDPELAPRITIEVEPPENETEEGAALKALGDGIDSLNRAAGGAVDVRAILEDHGIPMRTIEEMAEEREAKAEEAARLAQLYPTPPPTGGAPFGGGGGNGGGGGVGPGKPPPGKTGEEKMGSRYMQMPAVARYTFQGFSVAIENPKGSTRVWHDEAAQETGRTTMQHDYGYIEGAMGADKEELDCYVGPDANAKDVHVIHQAKPGGGYDEDKVMLGFSDAAAAKDAYLAHRNDGDAAFLGMSTHPVEIFRAKLQRRTGTGRIHARRHISEAIASAKALLDRAGELKRGAAQLSGRARKRQRLYGDRLADRAIGAAGDAMGPSLKAIKHEIDGAKDYKDLRRRLAARHKTLDGTEVEELVYRARVMADLGGRASAVRRI